MTSYLLMDGLPCLLAILAGAIAGVATALKLRPDESAADRPAEQRRELAAEEPEDDQFIDAEIDLAAVRWAEANNHPPEAASLMAERLRTLRKIGRRKGWME